MTRRNLLLALAALQVGCGPTGHPTVETLVAPARAAEQLSGVAVENARWPEICEALLDPVPPPRVRTPGGGDALHVSFDNRAAFLGLPREVVSSAVSAGRFGERLVLLVAGHDGGDSKTPGPPFVDLYVRCGTRFQPLGLLDRLVDAPENPFPGPFRATAVWDADSDGRNDLILESAMPDGSSRIAVLYHETDGRFRYTSSVVVGPNERLNAVAPIDLNRDGVLDMYLSLDTPPGRDDLSPQRLVLLGAKRENVEVTETAVGLGNEPTNAIACVPPLVEGRGRLCWIARTNEKDALVEETGSLIFEPLGVELPEGLSAGVTVLHDPFLGGVTFVASNIGRPTVVDVDATYTPTITSDEFPMRQVGVASLFDMTGPNRARVGRGLAYDHFSNNDCPGLVLANAVTRDEADLPIQEGAGLVYYERNCGAGDWGTKFVNKSGWTGAPFSDESIRDYHQVLVVHANQDLCPDLVVSAAPWDPDDPDHLLGNPPELRLLINRCNTPGNRAAVQLQPADYLARVVVTLDDGQQRIGALKPPALAGTHDPVVSFGLGEHTAETICVEWGESEAWTGPRTTCVPASNTDQLVTITREP